MTPNLAQLYRHLPAQDGLREAAQTLPGRGDVRVSLTQRCNLRCAHCHNEGQPPPWAPNKPPTVVTVESIVNLIEQMSARGVKSVKFTGGDPGVYPHLSELFDQVTRLQARHPAIEKWGISTNGIAFLNPSRYELLVTSTLDNICIGIDSVLPGEKSKPSSGVGRTGRKVWDQFVAKLAADWPGRDIKI